MKRIFVPQMSIPPAAQLRLWPALKPALSSGFVLYDGTAIALRLGHRPSVDFDFFSDQPLEKEILRAVFPFVSQATILQDELETFTLLVKDVLETEASYVKLSFFGRLSFGRVGEPELTTDEVMAVASLEDLMAHKLKVILQRIESKDYVDIAALLKAGVSLEKGLSAAIALYGRHFNRVRV